MRATALSTGKYLATHALLCNSICMSKDCNIRVNDNARKVLKKRAKLERRTLKVMFDIVVKSYEEKCTLETSGGNLYSSVG